MRVLDGITSLYLKGTYLEDVLLDTGDTRGVEEDGNASGSTVGGRVGGTIEIC